MAIGTVARHTHPDRPRIRHPEATFPARLLWPNLLIVLGYHLLLPLALIPWLFSWTGVVSVVLGNYVFCSLGIGAGYHRLLTHRGFKCSKWLEHTLAFMGACCLQDTPARWVAIHRLHHNHSDEQSDPHSPRVHWFWAHVGWLFFENRQLSRLSTYEKYAGDVLEDPFYLKLERKVPLLWGYAAHVLAFAVCGFVAGAAMTRTWMGGVQFAASMVLWGVVIRTIYTWHVTWAVNSIAHMWGYRNFETGEDSRNNWLAALLTNGEGWHNNHHADPRGAAHGQRWWEVDVTYISIRTLARMGLVWDVVTPHKAAKNSQIGHPNRGPRQPDHPKSDAA